MEHVHGKDIHLMIWETHPEKRKKKQFPVNVNIVKKRELNPGDKILIQTSKGDTLSIYTVQKVLSRRPSTFSKFDYCETVCAWVSGTA